MLLLLAFLAASHGFQSLHRFSFHSFRLLASGGDKEVNFSDDAVECLSEGGTTKLAAPTGPRINVDAMIRSTLDDSKEKKQGNFQDDDVSCVSEGGKWTINNDMVAEIARDYAMPVVKRRSFQELVGVVGAALQEEATPLGIVAICDQIDRVGEFDNSALLRALLKSIRYEKLVKMLKTDRATYIETATFLSSRIARADLPNLQDVPPVPTLPAVATGTAANVVPDCALPNVTYYENPLDVVLLSVFRGLVQKEIGWTSNKAGIKGLLEEGRHYMLSEQGTDENQHRFVKNVLAGLMTPVLPPFYRIFMSGILPSAKNGDPAWIEEAFQSIARILPDNNLQTRLAPGKQVGPWFYAPWLTSVVTPLFLNFLVGPSRTNRRVDGALGGIVVDKCKFLQESGCKGLCLHQCKLPAQQFFDETLGLPLTVTPNFKTQECQWSWGLEPLPYAEDPSFPKGCLSGCQTRVALDAALGKIA